MTGDQEASILAGKVVVVTGGGLGIGKAHSLRFAALGASVVVNDIGTDISGVGENRSVAQSVVDEIVAAGGNATANSDSIATVDGSGRLIETALDVYGRLDFIVNNAGITIPNHIGKATTEELDAIVAVHLNGSFNTIRHAAPLFMAQKAGVIVNTGSMSGLGHYGGSAYAAAKEAIIGLTRSVARDLGPFNVRCNAIRPGAMSRNRSDGRAGALAVEAETLYGFPAIGEIMLTKVMALDDEKPVQGDFEPHHIADFAAWLCTDAAANINGRTFRVVGGQIGLMSEPEINRTVYRKGGWSIADLDDPSVRQMMFGDLVNRFIDHSRQP
jgi:3-oxoacyl-[acyl-carrier protein] reductase